MEFMIVGLVALLVIGGWLVESVWDFFYQKYHQKRVKVQTSLLATFLRIVIVIAVVSYTALECTRGFT